MYDVTIGGIIADAQAISSGELGKIGNLYNSHFGRFITTLSVLGYRKFGRPSSRPDGWLLYTKHAISVSRSGWNLKS